ncbi:hypothetical protein IWX49DRAFT_3925 [Phyllosticta citricarpa]
MLTSTRLAQYDLAFLPACLVVFFVVGVGSCRARWRAREGTDGMGWEASSRLVLCCVRSIILETMFTFTETRTLQHEQPEHAPPLWEQDWQLLRGRKLVLAARFCV